MRGRFGTFAALSIGPRRAPLASIEVGPTADQLATVDRIAGEPPAPDPIPTPLELRNHRNGAKTLELAIRGGVINRDSRSVHGRRYRINDPGRRSTDGLEERIAAASIETRWHKVVATGGKLEIGRKRVPLKTQRQFETDLPELALGLARVAAQNFIEDFEPPTGVLRRVKVSTRGVMRAVILNNGSRILATATFLSVIAMPAVEMLGATLPVEVGAAGAMFLFGGGVAGASAKDRARRRRAAEVRRELDRPARAKAIHELNSWAHGMLRAREMNARRNPAGNLATAAQQHGASAGAVGVQSVA